MHRVDFTSTKVGITRKGNKDMPSRAIGEESAGNTGKYHSDNWEIDLPQNAFLGRFAHALT
jgi:hypothetical protein